jgi:hypothetical protein
VAHTRCFVARYIIDDVQDVYRLQGLKENVIVGRLIPAGTDLA